MVHVIRKTRAKNPTQKKVFLKRANVHIRAYLYQYPVTDIARSGFQEPIGWEPYLPLFVCRLSIVPHPWHLHLSPLYEVLDHTNQIFSVRIWSWQRVIIIISSYDDHHIIIWWSSYHHTAQNTWHMPYFWKEKDSRISNMTLAHHQCIISASSMHHQRIISASTVH